MNANASSDVRNAITSFVAANTTFTSGHVTAAVRNAGTEAGTLSHSDIGTEVRGFWNNESTTLFPNYSRTLVYAGGDQVYAYHPVSDDPNSVDLSVRPWPRRVDRSNFSGNTTTTAPASAPRRTVTRTAPAPATVLAASDLYNGGKDASDGDTFKVPYNADGYAQIPRPVTRLLGFDPGAGVVLEGTALSNTVTLRAARNGETPVARLQPANGQLRLRDRDLMTYGVGNGNDLVVTVNALENTLTLT